MAYEKVTEINFSKIHGISKTEVSSGSAPCSHPRIQLVEHSMASISRSEVFAQVVILSQRGGRKEEMKSKQLPYFSEGRGSWKLHTSFHTVHWSAVTWPYLPTRKLGDVAGNGDHFRFLLLKGIRVEWTLENK